MPIDKETQAVVTAIVSKELKEAFIKLCEKERRSVSAQITYLIERALSEDEK